MVVVKCLPTIKLPPRLKPGVVYIGPSDEDRWKFQIALGKALAHGHGQGAVGFLYAKLVEIEANGFRRLGRKQYFSRVDLIDIDIAKAYCAGHMDNVRFHIRRRAEQEILEAKSRRR
jgi:hypothetical protein